jgi:uncharacterized BrkB/YihY/UPF0761 family membrane protein
MIFRLLRKVFIFCNYKDKNSIWNTDLGIAIKILFFILLGYYFLIYLGLFMMSVLYSDLDLDSCCPVDNINCNYKRKTCCNKSAEYYILCPLCGLGWIILAGIFILVGLFVSWIIYYVVKMIHNSCKKIDDIIDYGEVVGIGKKEENN